jgi:ribosomal protein S18 acetylase RimI-like enzyme
MSMGGSAIGMAQPSLSVREARWEDRAAIYETLINSGIFGRSDAECVDEMFVETWEKPRPDGYRWLLATSEAGTPAGFACYGTESLTQDTWDLFWICVRPEARSNGVGRQLIDEAVRNARQDNGRVMVIYTSSTDRYAAARGLYEAAGFAQKATIPDYYSDGDSLLIYWKRLN